MSFNIIKQLNADAQEGSATNEGTETAAVTNVPVETPATEPVVAVAPVEERIVTAHDDFDWSVDKRNVSSYNKEEKAKYDVVYDNTFKQINDGEMIQATIEAITKTDAVVNIGFKSGMVSGKVIVRYKYTGAMPWNAVLAGVVLGKLSNGMSH